MTPRRAWLVFEPIALMLAIIASSWAIFLWVRPASPWMTAHYDDINTALFLYLPLIPILLDRNTTLADHGLGVREIPRGVLVFAATLAIVAPAFVLVMWLASQHGPSWFRPSFDLHVPRDITAVALFQLVQVALPEEFFFRGYAQGRLDRAFTWRINVLGAPLGPGALLANALFAIAHPLQIGPQIPGSWWRLETFFPGLLFAWMRARSGSLLAPLLMHWASNLLLFAVIRGG